jgi:hypothetical protein
MKKTKAAEFDDELCLEVLGIAKEETGAGGDLAAVNPFFYAATLYHEPLLFSTMLYMANLDGFNTFDLVEGRRLLVSTDEFDEDQCRDAVERAKAAYHRARAKSDLDPMVRIFRHAAIVYHMTLLRRTAVHIAEIALADDS